jgi:anti-sigma-K factor RskA
MNEADDLSVAEWALGLLDEAEAAAIGARIAVEPALQARADWWRENFSGLANDRVVVPDDRLWNRISAALPANDNSTALLRRWRMAAVASMILSVGLMSFIFTRPAPEPAQIADTGTASQNANVLLASLTNPQGVGATIAFDPTRGALAVAPLKLDAGAGDAELWVISADGVASSLGVIDTKTAATHSVAPAHRRLIAPGTSFAVTREPQGGSPTGKATGPIIASGKIFAT